MDVNLKARWHANLASPAELAGAAQMNGTASMAPGPKRGTTNVTLNLANASPGGLHPWEARLGPCGVGMGDGVFGGVVHASTANSETIVACGNLAPPTQ